jgi:hypothetical protein
MGVQPLTKVGLFVSFILNQETIANTLCIQKEVNDNACQGKCHLAKQLKQAEEQEQKNNSGSQKKQEESLYDLSWAVVPVLFFTVGYISSEKVYPVPNYMLSSYLATIFQPPQFV